MNKISLAECCTKTQEKLKAFLKAELIERGYSPIDQDGFLFAEGELPVMLTAHMDTVHHDNCTIVCTSPDGKYWMSPQGIGGDDRCGIFAIMKIIETHKCSVLFTEDEETGCVGAKKYADFAKKNPDKTEYVPKNLNYIIEIDRKNADDAVFYSCDNPDFEKFVTEDTGFKTAHGSCSDISYVAPALGVAAVNFSSGYYNPHQISEYINLAELNENIRRIKAIIDKPSEKFEYIEKKTVYSSYSGGYYGKKHNYDDYDYYNYFRGYGYDCGIPEDNFALEDFLLDSGAAFTTEDLRESMNQMSSSWTYKIHDEAKNEIFEYTPEDDSKFYHNEKFEVFEYDPNLKVCIACGCKILSRRFKTGNTSCEPWFASYSAESYYVIPPELYSDFYNYYMENAEYYAMFDEEPIDDTPELPVDDDIQKKDEMEEDILKLYN